MNVIRIVAAPLFVSILGWGIALGAPDEPTSGKGEQGSEKPAVAAADVGGGDEKKATAKIKKITKTEAEWKKQLTPMQFYVTRKQGTERSHTGETWNLYQPGTYSCVCCDLPLFSSKTKYKSGTGWPSFYDSISTDHLTLKEDRKLFSVRTEMVCARCDAHVGHVFEDGPEPTGQRYCANSAALKFNPAAQGPEASGGKDEKSADKDRGSRSKKTE